MSEAVGSKVEPTGSNQGRISPGLVKINGAWILAKDRKVEVTRLVFKINLYESIMSPFLTGSLTLNDATGLAEAFPFIGEEILILDVQTPGADEKYARREYAFVVYKMEERESPLPKTNLYTLQLMSAEAFTDMNTRVSQTFKGKISDTVKKLIESPSGLKTFKKVLVENTVNNEIHTSNFWSPTQNVYYLATKALNFNNNPNYVFFEGNEGFIFASLDTLYSGEPIQSFVKDQYSRQGSDVEDIDMEYKKILDMSIPTYYDYIDRLQQGYYGSSVYHYDIETKRLHFVARVAKDDFKKVNLNEFEVFGQELQFHPYGQMFSQVIQRNLYNGSPVLPVDHGLRRMSLLKRSEALVTNISVFGRFDYTVGRTVDLMVYAERELQAGQQDVLDTMLSGRYLISALNHEITGEKHMTYLELSKDSIARSLENTGKK